MSDDYFIKQLTKINPSEDTQGTEYCFFCQAQLDANQPHDDECIWKVAEVISKKGLIYEDIVTGVKSWNRPKELD